MKQEDKKITIKWVDINYFSESIPPNTFILKTKGNFLWRIWFLISEPSAPNASSIAGWTE